LLYGTSPYQGGALTSWATIHRVFYDFLIVFAPPYLLVYDQWRSVAVHSRSKKELFLRNCNTMQYMIAGGITGTIFGKRQQHMHKISRFEYHCQVELPLSKINYLGKG